MGESQASWLQSDLAVSKAVSAGRGILIVEDLPSTQERLSLLVGKVCPNGQILLADSVAAARRLIARQPIDLALIDLFLPDGSGVEVIHELARVDPLAPCIVATIYDDDDHLLPAFGAGAHGYLLKDQPDEVLVAQLQLAIDGVPPLAPAIARRLLRQFAVSGGLVASGERRNRIPEDNDSGRLTKREQVVLSLIAKGLQIAEVARALNISAHTVCSHLKSIYRKRNLSCRAEAALEAQRLGLV